jgi:hypothetical protein
MRAVISEHQLALLILVTGLPATARAAPVIVARTHDAESGKPLAGAMVTVQNSDIMAVTDDVGQCLVLARVARGGRLAAALDGYFGDTVVLSAVPRLDTLLIEFGLHRNLPRSVRGLVSDAAARLPLPEAVVSIAGTDRTARTLGDGSYSFSPFPYGTWTLRADFEGYQSETLRVTALSGETTEADFALRDTSCVGEVDGRVTDGETGVPIAGAAVSVTGTGWQATSDTAGYYVVERLPAGVYDLSAVCEGYRKGVTRFRVVKGWAVTVNLRLWKPGTEQVPKRPARGR